jgi:D-serine deaminase-like pyridoxal phosphate-dependent protein
MAEVSHDILVAYPPVGKPKLERLLSLPESVEITVALDSAAVATELAKAAAPSGRPVGVYVELDVGLRRVGLSRVEDLVNLVRLVSQTSPLIYRGISFYPGHIRTPVERQAEGRARLQRDLRASVQALGRAGLHPPVVSGGSTPTFATSHEIESLTEIRPGTYVYNDRTTYQIGACRWEDCALTVVATVVSTAVPGQAVIDAGTKSLGREPAEQAGEGFAALWDRPEVSVTRMSEEHGILDLSHTDWRPEVGEQVRLVPNHVCIAVQLHEVIYGARAGRIETSWPVVARGRRPLHRPLEV